MFNSIFEHVNFENIILTGLKAIHEKTRLIISFKRILNRSFLKVFNNRCGIFHLNDDDLHIILHLSNLHYPI